MELHFPILLDGATGTELQKRGYRGGISAEQWVLEHPDAITDLHNNYIEAGSDVLYAPTLGPTGSSWRSTASSIRCRSTIGVWQK